MIDWIKSRRMKNIALNLLTIWLSIALVIFSFEVVLIAGIIGDKSTESYPRINICRESGSIHAQHPAYRMTFNPSVRYLRQPAPNENWNLYQINANGFRDTYATGEENIIVLGDSFMAGYNANQSATYPYLLDRWSDNTEIKNYGVPSWGTAEQLILYKNISSDVDHDLVILAYYLGNDAQNNANTIGSQYELSNGQLIVRNSTKNNTSSDTTNDSTTPDAPSETTDTTEPESKHSGLIGGRFQDIQDFLRENTETYDFVAANSRGLLERVGLIQTQGYIHPHPPTGEKLNKQVNLTQTLVENIAIEAESNNADVLIVTIPESGDVNPENPSQYLPEDGRPYWQSQRQMLESISENRMNVHLLTLKQVMISEIKSGNRVYGSDLHFNEYGYAVAANATHNWLHRNGYIMERDTVPNLSNNSHSHSRPVC